MDRPLPKRVSRRLDRYMCRFCCQRKKKVSNNSSDGYFLILTLQCRFATTASPRCEGCKILGLPCAPPTTATQDIDSSSVEPAPKGGAPLPLLPSIVSQNSDLVTSCSLGAPLGPPPFGTGTNSQVNAGIEDSLQPQPPTSRLLNRPII